MGLIPNEQFRSKEDEFRKWLLSLSFKNKDALHIASAILSECEYFITTDDIILKRYKGNEI